MSYKTEQEKFWSGEFGNDYTDRNKSKNAIASNIALFSEIIKSTKSISSVIELGANIGLNLEALMCLLPLAEYTAVEINEKAANYLKMNKRINVFHSSMLDFKPDSERDLVILKGVLIHINPDELGRIYDLIYRTSKKYICFIEYYNPIPTKIEYRGHKDKLYKRDFAGEMMDKYSCLDLIDYGFVYHRDCNFPQDDVTWFLMGKN